MKGIILAGGSGSRLYPLTKAISKQLLPVFDKPMIYYPLSVLMLAEIREILIISTPHDLPAYQRLLGDGSQLGLRLEYREQPEPKGLAQAFVIGESFIGDSKVSLILGDNIFFGHDFSPRLKKVANSNKGATLFGYQVNDPERFGVIGFDDQRNVTSIEEKPANPKSSFVATGLYFYDNDVISIAKQIQPSPRGELEISDINQAYLANNQLKVELLGRGFTWLDTGTHETLNEASDFVKTIEKHQGFKIACLEEIAHSKKWIDDNKIYEAIRLYGNTMYGNYLKDYIGKS